MSDLNGLKLYSIPTDNQYMLGHSMDVCKDKKHNRDIIRGCHPVHPKANLSWPRGAVSEELSVRL